jgi:hypothetical protein
VIVQDTGFSEDLPCGDGLFAFRTTDDAVDAVHAIARDYEAHCAVARRIAEEYFDAAVVIAAILRASELSPSYSPDNGVVRVLTVDE